MKKQKLLDQVRDLIKTRRLSHQTEKSYIYYIRDFILFHKKRHPTNMGIKEIRNYLTHLAVRKRVAASTQNVALNALLFLYKQVLDINLPKIDGVVRAGASRKLPTVFSKREARAVIAELSGTAYLVSSILYGSGLRLSEALRLRIKDVDFENQIVLVHDGKGAKDRRAILPATIKPALARQIETVKAIHIDDIRRGFGTVHLPGALARKYPNANKSMAWQYLFPSTMITASRSDGVRRRHHTSPSTIQRAVKGRSRNSISTSTRAAIRFGIVLQLIF